MCYTFLIWNISVKCEGMHPVGSRPFRPRERFCDNLYLSPSKTEFTLKKKKKKKNMLLRGAIVSF